MTNSVDPDQMASSGSTLLAKVGVVVNSRIRVNGNIIGNKCCRCNEDPNLLIFVTNKALVVFYSLKIPRKRHNGEHSPPEAPKEGEMRNKH